MNFYKKFNIILLSLFLLFLSLKAHARDFKTQSLLLSGGIGFSDHCDDKCGFLYSSSISYERFFNGPALFINLGSDFHESKIVANSQTQDNGYKVLPLVELGIRGFWDREPTSLFNPYIGAYVGATRLFGVLAGVRSYITSQFSFSLEANLPIPPLLFSENTVGNEFLITGTSLFEGRFQIGYHF